MSDEQTPQCCHACGWDFTKVHTTYLPDKGRTRFEKRTQINIATKDGMVIRCDDCYERELIRANRHRYSDITPHDMRELGKTAWELARCMPFLAKHLPEEAA